MNINQLYKFIQLKSTKRVDIKHQTPITTDIEVSELQHYLKEYEEKNHNSSPMCYEGILNNNIIVIDIDTKNNPQAYNIYLEIAEKHPELNLLPIEAHPFYTKTKSAGFHLYYKIPAGVDKQTFINDFSSFHPQGSCIEIKTLSITMPFSSVLDKNDNLGYYTISINKTTSEIATIGIHKMIKTPSTEFEQEDMLEISSIFDKARKSVYSTNQETFFSNLPISESHNIKSWVGYVLKVATYIGIKQNCLTKEKLQQADYSYFINKLIEHYTGEYTKEEIENSIQSIISNKSLDTIYNNNYKAVIKYCNNKEGYITLEDFIVFVKEKVVCVATDNNYKLYNKDTKEEIASNNYQMFIAGIKKFGQFITISIPMSEITTKNEYRWLSLGFHTKTPKIEDIDKNQKYFYVDVAKLLNKNCSLWNELVLEHNITSFITTKNTYEYDLTKEYGAVTGSVINLADRKEFCKPYKSVNQGDWSLIKHHLMNLVNEEEGLFNHLIQLYARKLKNPLKKEDDSVVVFCDKGGSGKNVWFSLLDELNGNICGKIVPTDRISLPNFHRTKFSYISEVDGYGKSYIIMGRIKQLTEETVTRDKKNQSVEEISNFNMLHIATNNLHWLSKETSTRRFLITEGAEKLQDYFLEKGIDKETFFKYVTGVSALKFNSNEENLARKQLSAFVYYLLNEVDTTKFLGSYSTNMIRDLLEVKQATYNEHPFNNFLSNLKNCSSKEEIAKAFYSAYSGRQTCSEGILQKELTSAIKEEHLIISEKGIKISAKLLRTLFFKGETEKSLSYFNQVTNLNAKRVYRNSSNKMIKGQTFTKEQE